MLRYNLEKQGFRVEEAADGQEALTRISEAPPDLVLLDWMLPVMSGIEVCRQICRRAKTRDLPVIMVTARTEDQDAVRGLNTGADDYIIKPFSMDALLARIRALLRRSNAVPTKGQLTFHDITMDLAAHRVQRNGRPIHLGPTEFRLLEFFMQHPRRVFSREELLDAVWGPDIHVEPRTVDVHIRRLRKAINATASWTSSAPSAPPATRWTPSRSEPAAPMRGRKPREAARTKSPGSLSHRRPGNRPWSYRASSSARSIVAPSAPIARRTAQDCCKSSHAIWIAKSRERAARDSTCPF